MKKSKMIVFKTTQEQGKEIERKASQMGVSMSDVIRISLNIFLSNSTLDIAGKTTPNVESIQENELAQ